MFTRFTRSRLARRLTITLAALAAAAGLAIPLAGAASAAPLQGEFFTLTFPAAAGTAYGPVHGAFTDNETSDTSGIWTFARGEVRVDHTAVGQPDINPRTCQGFLSERGRWEMEGVSGRYRDAFGFGRFRLFEFVQVARVHRSECDPDQVIYESVYVTGSGLATR